MDVSLLLRVIIYGISILSVNLSNELAKNKPVKSSRVYSSYPDWKAEKAVDGNTNDNVFCDSCLHTSADKGIKEAHFQIDLTGTFNIERVEIYYRAPYQKLFCSAKRNNSYLQNYRFRYYSIYISDTKDWKTGEKCYQDNSMPYPDLYQNNTCVGQGSFITVYNDKKPNTEPAVVLELCEVMVFGCAAGFYGPSCKTTCSNCVIGFCRAETGECLRGCKDGWTEQKCETPCSDGYYGKNCSSKCGQCLRSGTCFNTNGTCPEGCKEGYDGQFCNNTCREGTFGFNCNETCGNCINGSACDYKTGRCITGCDAGWTGLQCKAECSESRYSYNCNETCGQCAGLQSCDKVSGACVQGCNPGWSGNNCKTECPPGTYGSYCNKTCGNCSDNEPCNKVNGFCMSGCRAGWKSPLCTTECVASGWYGASCSHMCSIHCKGNLTCNHIDGRCPLGCEAGFVGTTCSEQDQEDNSIGVTVGVSITVISAIIIGIIIFLMRYKPIKGVDESIISVGGFANSLRGHTLSRQSGKKEDAEYASVNVTYIENDLEKNNTLKASANGNEVIPLQNMEEEQVYYMETNKTEISVSDLRRIVAEKIELGVLAKEFKNLPKGLKLPHDAGKIPENKLKNRYLTTFPYDHSMVKISKIDDKPNSDYINANYIDGIDEPSAYIASQGPKRVTLFDFWRMIWENNSEKIVMLANLEEMGSIKCKKYWPDDNKTPLIFNHLKVSLKREQVHGSFTFRYLEVANTNYKKPRFITHFHFTSWPDHGTPDPMQLVLFNHLVTKSETSLRGPITVHCSAGIGRTGVYIALAEMLKIGRQTGKIDVVRFVHMMRENRTNMIQTEGQYIFLHNVLTEAFMLNGHFIPKGDFVAIVVDIRENTAPENGNRITEEFQFLNSIRPTVDEESRAVALSDENFSKNRNKDILPSNSFRPLLTSQTTDQSDYINAVIIPTLHSDDGMVVTQYPLMETIQDFWRLVYERHSNVLVILDENQEFSLFPSTNESVRHGTIIVQSGGEVNVSHNIKQQKVSIYEEGKEDMNMIQVLETKHWPEESDTPPSHELLLDLFAHAYRCCVEQRNSSITVVCRDGARKSGLFSAIYLVLETSLKTDEVNIFPTVRQLQLRRPEFLKSVEQYEYCYNFVDRYLEETSDYANT